MRNNKKLFLAAAAMSGFFLISIFTLARARGPVSGASALDSLLDTAGPSTFVEVFPARANPPAAVAGTDLYRILAAAPKPGKDLSPAVHDPIRVEAVMKLLSDICNGNHLPYSQDGATFKNKEGKLPVKPSGFYKEYTLLTGSASHSVTIGDTTYQVAPDLSARGSERLIIGGGEKLYYTPDHYKNFIELAVVY